MTLSCRFHANVHDAFMAEQQEYLFRHPEQISIQIVLTAEQIVKGSRLSFPVVYLK
jgi:hypothetical protein